MFGIVNYGGFITASVLLNLTPGSDTIYILSKSISGGRRQGVASALGILGGILIHTVLAALGLSAILATSAVAFNAMKILGAAYLIVMGVRTLMAKQSLFAISDKDPGSAWTAFRQGVLTNALNPKVALFFLALLPQYVSASSAGPLPFLLLGLTFVGTSTVWCMLLAYFSSFMAAWLNKSERVGQITNKVTGCIYILLGLNVLRAKAAG